MATIKDAISKARAPSDFPVKFVAIDGHGGSGKSTLAEKLAREFGAEIVLTDDFASWDHPFDWWPLVIERVFEPIKDGAKTLSYPRSKWWVNHHPEPVVDQPVTQVMILEGVSSSRKEFGPYLTYKIWVETPKEICLQRGMERDKRQGTEQEIRDLWDKWVRAEDAYVAGHKPMRYADIIVDGTKPL